MKFSGFSKHFVIPLFLCSKRQSTEKLKYKNKNRIKKPTAAALKNELKYSPMSEGNFCIAEPNLTLKIIQ